MIWFLMLFDFIATGADAFTDAHVDRKIEWWRWHCWKWVRLYIPKGIAIYALFKAGLIPISWVSVWIGAGYVLISWLLWKTFYLGEKYYEQIQK